jgi:hypothetical protein
MDDTERIVAAIFAAGMCQGKTTEAGDYFKSYDQCLAIFRARLETARDEASDRRR